MLRLIRTATFLRAPLASRLSTGNLVSRGLNLKSQSSKHFNSYSTAAELAEPEVEANPSLLDVKGLDISPLIKRSLEKKGINALFSIQADCFPHIIDGKDLVGRARTGTGKTLAFALPIVEKLERDNRSTKYPRVLVLAPTRELANQVEAEIATIAGKNYKTLCIYGGSAYTPQENALARGVDIVVGTPGRIMDLISKKSLILSEINTLVLDEADHMLDIGFSKDLDVIIEEVQNQTKNRDSLITTGTPKVNKYQFLLFSATLPDWIKKTVRKYLESDYVTIDHVGNDVMKASKNVNQLAIPTLSSQIPSTVSALLQTYTTSNGRCVVFCQTKSFCNDLATDLGKIKGVNALALHGDVSQSSREIALRKFKQGTITCLVATDVAARGLDISDVELVIQAEVPRDPETFIHRSGRTGRAGKSGTCVTLFSPQKNKIEMDNIRRVAGVEFKIVKSPDTADAIEHLAKDFSQGLSKIKPSSITKMRELLGTHFETLPEYIKEDPQASLAAGFYLFSRSSSSNQSCPPRSLIDAKDGYVTLLAHGSTRTTDISQLLYTDYKLDPLDVDLKNLSLVSDKSGVVFDVRASFAKSILEKQEEMPTRITLSLALELPKIQAGFSDLRSNSRMNKRQTTNTRASVSRYTPGRSDRDRSSGNSGYKDSSSFKYSRNGGDNFNTRSNDSSSYRPNRNSGDFGSNDRKYRNRY